MPDSRNCKQCGAQFVPRREHAQFCSAPCRAAWNRENADGDPELGLNALRWSVRSMDTAVGLLGAVREWDRASAFTAITDAVWSMTIIDAALVRHHPVSYDRELSAQPRPQQRLIVGSLAGLRFVRNQTADPSDLAQFVDPEGTDARVGPTRITGWRWRHVPQPKLGSRPGRAQAWKLERYRGYEEQLAGETIEVTVGRVLAFLEGSVASVGSTEGVDAPVAPQNDGA